MSLTNQRPDTAAAFTALADAKCVDAKLFREAMSRLGAAVHVITTDGPKGRAGITATAACSVSDSPPTVLICVNRAAATATMLQGNGVFCLNTLRAGDEPVADTFAGRTKVAREARFETGEWTELSTGAPVLTSAVVAFDCRVADVKSVASHDIYFGVVEAVYSGEPGAALVYHDRLYKQV